MSTYVWSAPVDEAPAGPAVGQRAEWAAQVVDTHGQLTGLGPYENGDTDGVVHVLTDLMHLAATRGVDFTGLLRSAQLHFLEERLLAGSRR
jgi:hypothetical protein